MSPCSYIILNSAVEPYCEGLLSSGWHADSYRVNNPILNDKMSSANTKSVICLMGPTAAGKTQLAVELCDSFPFEIISVDSALIYRGMDIGTAKPTPAVLARAPHRLIDIKDPSENYSAAQFCEDAVQEIEAIFQKGRIPLLVGGTMLYFRAFQKGLAALPSADSTIRDDITQKAFEQGWPALHAHLKLIDPMAAARIHPHDSQRIQRALEVYRLTGKSLTEWQQATETPATSFTIHNLGLIPDNRQRLHERIAARFHMMLAAGFLAEVDELFKRPDLSLDLPAMRSVGYRQVWEYLEGKSNGEEMIEKAIAATRQLAKRQLTWLRSWENLIAFDSDQSDLKCQVVDTIGKMLEK